MDGRRQLKIASVIKETFTKILSREGKGIYGKAFVTVTNVTVTSDLTLVRFYLSIFNTETPDAVIKSFNEHKHDIKRHLAADLRHQLRRIPEIEFFRDDTLDYVQRINEVFKKISEDDKKLHEPQQEPVKAAKPRAKKAAAKKSK